MISETIPATSPRGHGFDLLPPYQSHGSTGLAANDLLSPMVQNLQPRRGPAGAGMPAWLSPAPGRNMPCSRGAREALKPISPISLSISQLSPICPSKAMGWTPQTHPRSPRHQCQCTSSLPSWCHSGGPLIAGGPIAVGPPVPSSCCVRSRGCLHGNGVRSVVRVAMYTWTAVGLPQIKMMMKYLAGPGVHWGSPIPGQAWGPHLQGLKGEVPNSGCRG